MATCPASRTLLKADIPTIELPGGAGSLRVIAGRYGAIKGPTRTFTELNMRDVALKRGKPATPMSPRATRCRCWCSRARTRSTDNVAFA